MISSILLSLCLSADPVPLLVDQAAAQKGTVKAGPVLRHVFVVKHSGQAGTITLTHVEVGCGCLQPSVSKSVLAAGESSHVAIDINTLTQSAGAQTWQARLHLKYDVDGTSVVSNIPLAVTATLDREITVTPPMIAMSTTGEAKQAITITDKRRNGPLPIAAVESTNAHLRTVIQLDGSVLVELLATAPADGKAYAETVVIRTNDPTYPELRVPVSIVKSANDPIAVNPLSFEIRIDGPSAATIQLRDRSGSLIAIESAVCAVNGVTLAFSKGANPIVAIKATVDRAVAGSTGQTHVTVKLSNGVDRIIPLSWK